MSGLKDKDGSGKSKRLATRAKRIVELYVRLIEGKVVKKLEEMDRYCVDERTIERDFAELRALFSEMNAAGDEGCIELVYDKANGWYYAKNPNPKYLDNNEILALCKIILESRAFSKNEMRSIIERLINGCVPREGMNLARKMLVNEMYHYVELQEKDASLDVIWELGECIGEHEVIEIRFHRQDDDTVITRTVEPLGIMFSEYYFYLNAFIVSQKEDGKLKQWYDYPTIFRIDRISSISRKNIKFAVPYSNRFQEGEYRKKIQFMYAGEPKRVTFRFTGPSVNAILDRLPTAEILSKDGEGYTVRAEAFGQGLYMWLLSQGPAVEIISPPSAREEMKAIILQMAEKYK